MRGLIRKATHLRLEIEDAISNIIRLGIVLNKSGLREQAYIYYKALLQAWEKAKGPDKIVLERLLTKARWIDSNVRSDICLDEDWVSDLYVAVLQLSSPPAANEDGVSRHRLVQNGSTYTVQASCS